MATSVHMLYVHAMAWSEPTFIFAALTGILLLADYMEHREWWRLVLAAMAFGVTALDRYVGMASVGMGIFVLVVLGAGS